MDGSFKVAKWYSIRAYAQTSLVSFESQLYTEQLNVQGISYYVSATNSFRFGKGWRIDLSGRIMSDQVASQLLIKGYSILDLGIQKNILGGKGTIKITASDLFYTRKGDGIINNLQLTNADWNSTMDSRSVRVAFSLRFGKRKMSKKKYNGSGSDEEQDRVRG